MRNQLFMLALMALTLTVSGQDLSKKNEIFIELGGKGLLGSVNYARQLTNKPALEIRAGLGTYGTDPNYLTVPLSLNYIINIGSKHTFLDVGAGATYTHADVRMYAIFEYRDRVVTSAPLNFMPSIGYRRYTTKDYSWRISFTPVVNKHGFLPSFGISGGKRF
jgi:hypothetical protein